MTKKEKSEKKKQKDMEGGVKERLVEAVMARATGGTFSDTDMAALAQLFPPAVLSIALEAALSRGVVRVVAAPSGRTGYEFCFGGTRHFLLLCPEMLFCPCDAVAGEIEAGGEPLICKHLLAAKIAVATKSLVEETVSDAEFAERCLQSAKFLT